MSECISLFFAVKVESINLSILTPLVKNRGCLVVFEILQYSTVYDNLVKWGKIKVSPKNEQFMTRGKLLPRGPGASFQPLGMYCFERFDICEREKAHLKSHLESTFYWDHRTP